MRYTSSSARSVVLIRIHSNHRKRAHAMVCTAVWDRKEKKSPTTLCQDQPSRRGRRKLRKEDASMAFKYVLKSSQARSTHKPIYQNQHWADLKIGRGTKKVHCSRSKHTDADFKYNGGKSHRNETEHIKVAAMKSTWKSALTILSSILKCGKALRRLQQRATRAITDEIYLVIS